MGFNITINFANNGMNNRSRDAFAAAYGYQNTIDGQPNPETKTQFRDRKIKEFIKDIVKAEERRTALATVPDITVDD